MCIRFDQGTITLCIPGIKSILAVKKVFIWKRKHETHAYCSNSLSPFRFFNNNSRFSSFNTSYSRFLIPWVWAHNCLLNSIGTEFGNRIFIAKIYQAGRSIISSEPAGMRYGMDCIIAFQLHTLLSRGGDNLFRCLFWNCKRAYYHRDNIIH